MTHKKFDHAIVIGGSIAGLTAARVLTDYFAQVTVIERDHLQGMTDFRKGVPQARHAHGLMLRGLRLLDQMFPGLEQELLAGGAIQVDPGVEQDAFIQGQWLPRFETDLRPIGCSRVLLEQTIYQQASRHPQINIREGYEVQELLTDEGRTKATGVVCRARTPAAAAETLLADLIVDASGRSSNTPEWLAQLGYTPPKESVVNSFPGYSTRIYERPANFTGTWKVLIVFPVPPDRKRGGVIFPLEGNRWHVTLFGMMKDHPPTDEAGYLTFAQSLPSLRVYEAIEQARPLSAISGYRQAENRLYHYDQLPRYLEHFIVIGDAVYALNPVYGQGMTVAAMGSTKLAECLQSFQGKENLIGLAAQFQKALGKIVAGPWQMATGEDMRWLNAEGGQALDFPTRLIQKYMNLVVLAIGQNPKVTAQFFRVLQMVDEPTVLFKPAMMLEILRTVYRIKRAQKTAPGDAAALQPTTG